MTTKYIAAFILSYAIIIGGYLAGEMFVELNKQYHYMVGFDTCRTLTNTNSAVIVTDCESGLTYINPESYRRIALP